MDCIDRIKRNKYKKELYNKIGFTFIPKNDTRTYIIASRKRWNLIDKQLFKIVPVIKLK